MDLPLNIEPMTHQDLAAVAAIERQSFKDPWSIHSFQTEIETNRLALYLVARLHERVIAYIGAWIVLNEVHITTLAVDKAYRRLGIASRLVMALVEMTGPRGASCLTLEVRPSNTAALRFYEELGFTVLGRRKYYYADEDALIMTKNNLTLPERIKRGGGHES